MSINTNLTNTVYTFSSKIWFVHFWFCLDFKLSPDGLFVSILWFFHSYHQTILPSSISQFTGILLSWLEHSVHSLPNVYVTGHCFHNIVHALTSNKAFWWQFWSFTLRLSCILWRQVSFSLDVGYWVNLPELATVDKRDWEFCYCKHSQRRISDESFSSHQTSLVMVDFTQETLSSLSRS